MVIGRLALDSRWLHARIGRRLPIACSRRGNRDATNARIRPPEPVGVLRPTVYLAPERAVPR